MNIAKNKGLYIAHFSEKLIQECMSLKYLFLPEKILHLLHNSDRQICQK